MQRERMFMRYGQGSKVTALRQGGSVGRLHPKRRPWAAPELFYKRRRSTSYISYAFGESGLYYEAQAHATKQKNVKLRCAVRIFF